MTRGFFIKQIIAHNTTLLKTLYTIIIAICGYVFMEWVFFLTKPSFMSNMNAFQKIEMLPLTVFLLAAPAVSVGALIYGIKVLLNKVFPKVDFAWFDAVLPTLITASLGLILIDNFTYTVFKFGVVSTDGIWRSAYALAFIVLFVLFFRRINRFITSSSRLPRPGIYLALSILIFSFLILILTRQSIQMDGYSQGVQSSAQLPNIILLGIDGVNAENMSVYGYARDTTPNIKALANNALIVENAFSNSGNTGGSLTSILTGKLPTETRVLYPPDILMGEDAYQHLPGILRQLGYQTIQVTMPSFGDAYERNIRNGFDVSNFSSEKTFPLLNSIDKQGGGNGIYLTTLIFQRISDRFKHAFFIQKMLNPYDIVTKPTVEVTERQRFNAMISYLNRADRPVFLHVHMLATHGPTFQPRKNIFSKDKEQTERWMVDFYDDAIYDFDRYVNILFKNLYERGQINNTIVILYSDHGMDWEPRNRVPLIIWFPHNQYTGKIYENVQLIDIAPTLLEYLEVPEPAWMTGQSLLKNNLSSSRSIFSMSTAYELVIENEGIWGLNQAKISPPFYQLAEVNLIVCDEWFTVNLMTQVLLNGKVEGSSAACSGADIPSVEEALGLIRQRLKQDYYDISSLQPDIPSTTSTEETRK